MSHPHVGVIGVGALGICLVERLVSGEFPVVVFDADRRATARAVEAGAAEAADPREMARTCDVIVVCVTGPDDVQEVLLGQHGAVASVGPGSVVLDLTTSLPDTSRLVGERLADRGARYLDAPVSRGVPAAQRGELSIMVGGERDTLEAARPVLERFGTDIVPVGTVGAGHAVKLLNMMLMGCHLVAASEAFGMAALSGTAPDELVARLHDSPAASYMTGNHLPKFALSKSYCSGFTLDLMVKDLNLAARLTDAGSAPLFMRALGQYRRAQRDLGSADNMRIAPYLAAKAAGTTSEHAVLAAREGILPNARRTAQDISALVAVVAAANAMACQEACAIARSHGLNVEIMLNVVNMSSGASRFTADPRRTPRNADATALPFELDTAPVLARAALKAVADRRL